MKINAGSFEKEIDDRHIDETERSVSSDGILVQNIADSFLEPYCHDLDIFMDALTKKIVTNPSVSLANEEIEQDLLQLTSLLYYATNASENLGIKADLAETMRKDVYNTVLISTNGTIIDKNATADASSLGEKIIQIGYQRAYNKIRAKVQMALEMQTTLKKILSNRMLELDNFSKGGSGNE